MIENHYGSEQAVGKEMQCNGRGVKYLNLFGLLITANIINFWNAQHRVTDWVIVRFVEQISSTLTAPKRHNHFTCK